MKLFFETDAQCAAFLAVLPLGMLLAACLDLATLCPCVRPVFDVALTLLFAVALLVFLLWSKADGLRLYHLLALAVGAILYVRGIGALFRLLVKKLCPAGKKNEKSMG